MEFLSRKVEGELSDFIESFWWFEDAQPSTEDRKIIPDGYPEIIFHSGDPYRINIDDKWYQQSKFLLAGQIRKFFLLQSTGVSRMFGIKLKPWAPYYLFRQEGSELTDTVVPLEKDTDLLKELLEGLQKSQSFEECIQHSNSCFRHFIDSHQPVLHNEVNAVKKIIEHHGRVDIQQLCTDLGIGERSLERYFKRYIGLSPKFYSRIVRFAHIVRLANNEKRDWSEITYYAGFYDQSHFIKNFREFTGEEPSAYGFSEKTLGNLFFHSS